MTYQPFLKRYPIATYFVLAYAISWLVWSPLVASAQGWLDAPISPAWHHVGAFGPMLAAFFATGVSSGTVGIRDLLGRMVRWRVGVGWLVVALFSPAAFFLLAVVFHRDQQGVWANLCQFGRILEFPELGWGVAWLFWTVTFGLGEETGWRGFALARLQKDRSALSATLIVCAFWALWHLPMFFFKETYLAMGVGGAIGFFFTILPGAIWLTWLYNSANESILIVALWHGAWNTAIAGTEGTVSMTMSIFIMVAAVIIVLGAGSSRLSRVPTS